MLLGGLLDPDVGRRHLPLDDGAEHRPRVAAARGALGARAAARRRARASRPGIPIRYDDPREVGPDRIVNAVAARERYGAPVDRRRLRDVDELRRRLAAGRVRRRRARAGHRDLDGGAVRARGAARERRLRGAAERDREDDGRRASRAGSSTASRARSTGSSRASAGELEAPDAPVDRDRRPCRADRAAQRDDRARRPVPHARGSPARVGAERVIPDPGTLAVFALASFALAVVPGPGRAVHRRAERPRRPARGSGLGASASRAAGSCTCSRR